MRLRKRNALSINRKHLLGYTSLLLMGLFGPSNAYAVCTQAGCDRYNFEVPVAIINPTNSPALVTTNGNVGFGTETPLQPLHVIGNARLESNSTSGAFLDFVISDATGFTTTRFGTAQGGDFIFQSVDDSYLNPVTRVVISRSGKVGIGTETPSRTLHIQGDDGMHLSPSALPTLPAAGDIAIDSDDSNIMKYYNGSAWVNAGSGGGGGSGSVTSIATGTGLTGGPITTTGTISIAAGGVGTTEIGDAQVTDEKISSVGANKISSGSGLYLTYKPDNTACASGQVLKWQNSRWECGDDNNSGSSSPLTSKGDIFVHNGSANAKFSVGSDGMVLKADSSQATGLAWGSVVASDLSSLVTTGIVQRNGSSSYSTVTVASPLSYTGGTLGLNTGSSGILLDGGNTLSSDMTMGTNSNHKLQLKTNNANRLTIDTSGNVGIGTTTPERPLHVAGAIRLSATTIPTSPAIGDIAIDENDSNALKYYNGTSWVTAGGSSGGGSGPWTTSGSDISYSGGNVGIGTSSPTKALEVSGDALIHGVKIGRGGASVVSNTAVGSNALELNSGGADNVAVGQYSSHNNTSGERNTAIGKNALYTNQSGWFNTAVGFDSLKNSLEGNNTGVGVDALLDLTTGSNNTAVGTSAAFGLSIGSKNTFVGAGSSGSSFQGSNNTVIGASNWMGYGTPWNDNVIIGSNMSLTTATTGHIYIGDGAGNVRIRVDNTGKVGIGIASPSHILHINGQGRATNSAWATTSDIRLKDLYGEFSYGLKEILSLDTVWFRYKKDNPLGLPSEELHAGVVAQQVESVIPEAVEKSKDGYLTLNADPIHWATVNAVKELAAQHQEDQKQIKALQSQQKALLQYICSKDESASFCQ